MGCFLKKIFRADCDVNCDSCSCSHRHSNSAPIIILPPPAPTAPQTPHSDDSKVWPSFHGSHVDTWGPLRDADDEPGVALQPPRYPGGYCPSPWPAVGALQTMPTTPVMAATPAVMPIATAPTVAPVAQMPAVSPMYVYSPAGWMPAYPAATPAPAPMAVAAPAYTPSVSTAIVPALTFPSTPAPAWGQTPAAWPVTHVQTPAQVYPALWSAAPTPGVVHAGWGV